MAPGAGKHRIEWERRGRGRGREAGVKRANRNRSFYGRKEGCPLRKGKYWIGGAGRVVSRGYRSALRQRGVFRDRESHFSLHLCKCVASDGTMFNQINDRPHSKVLIYVAAAMASQLPHPMYWDGQLKSVKGCWSNIGLLLRML